MRHGIVAFDTSTTVTAQTWPDLLDRFNASLIAPESLPSQSLCKLAQSVSVVVSSDLPRAIASAGILAPGQSVQHKSLFREAEVPRKLWLPFKVRFRVGVVWARLLWWAGATTCESRHTTRQRAQRAATCLESITGQVDSVALVGHGYFNGLVARELCKRGWRGPRLASRRHWGVTQYSRTSALRHDVGDPPFP